MSAAPFCPESLLHLLWVLLHQRRVAGSETERQCKRPLPRTVVFPRLGDLERKCKQIGLHQHSVSENPNKIIVSDSLFRWEGPWDMMNSQSPTMIFNSKKLQNHLLCRKLQLKVKALQLQLCYSYLHHPKKGKKS